ncbi:MAG: acyl-CoA reductase [Microscillaceae bacterium]|nr:acyl-CoA reductase [Microscillaceae bacterium]MDW8459795.1 acyl-CoA reductase [Cytophagales bacterium]
MKISTFAIEQRIAAFVKLGQTLKLLAQTETWNDVLQEAYAHNPWFTVDNINFAWQIIVQNLQANELFNWLQNYELTQPPVPKKIGVLAAGNIPLVCFQDVLCVLVSGHNLYLKMSSEDNILPRLVLNKLVEIAPEFASKIHYVEQLKGVEAIIATGSDTSARHFRYYFRHIPNIIRHNRNSVAVLSGKETAQEIQLLADDIFRYFGLGCRSVTKLYVPENYDFTFLLDNFEPWRERITQHYKYNNNYDYHKALFLLNKTPHLDNGFLLVTQDPAFASPIGVLHYEIYQDIAQVIIQLKQNTEKIQCIVSHIDLPLPRIPFGQTQMPKLWDYADNIDILEFLIQLSAV